MPASRVNPPKQSRSRRTLERLVTSALEILEEQGADALTVQAIVGRAGSSVGSFYARFKGKDDLLDYVGERIWREGAERWDQALAGQDWSSMGLRAVAWGAASLLAQAGSTRATFLRALDRSPALRDDAYRTFQEHVLAGMEELMLERSAEIVHPDPRVGVRLGLRAMLAVVQAHIEGADGRPLPADRVQTEAVTILLAYLGNERRGADSSPENVDFFDIWG